MTTQVVLFSYKMKLNISKSKAVTKVLSKKLYCDLYRSSQCNKKIVGEIFVSLLTLVVFESQALKIGHNFQLLSMDYYWVEGIDILSSLITFFWTRLNSVFNRPRRHQICNSLIVAN